MFNCVIKTFCMIDLSIYRNELYELIQDEILTILYPSLFPLYQIFVFISIFYLFILLN